MTMFYPKEICCLCLKTSVMLNDLFSIDKNGTTQFDKISRSLTRVANVIELDGDLLICEGCCDKIDSIYSFSNDCLKNLKILTTKTLNEQDSNKLQCKVGVKLKKNVKENKIVVTSSKDERELIIPTLNNDITVETKATFIKVEYGELEPIISTDDTEFPVIANTSKDITVEMKESLIKTECDPFDEMEQEFVEISSQLNVAVENEDHPFASDNGTRYSIKIEKEDYDEYNLNSDDGKSSKYELSENKSSNKNQMLVRKEQRCKNKKHICHVCHKIFKQKGHLNIHLRIHFRVKPFTCDNCEKSFNTKGSLDRHMFVHSGKELHTCDVCTKVFSRKYNLVIHKLIHSGEKPFSCNMCDKSFAHINYLVVHKRMHVGDKPFTCDLCDKAFTQKAALNTHRRLHTGEKPYSCDNCNKAFAQKAVLNYHKRVHKH